MNPIDERLLKGTFGEILVQLRLLQYGVQSAPPLKDSGNDLIAVNGEVFKAIQVKTVTYSDTIRINLPDREYHILALVVIDPCAESNNIKLDDCHMFLIPKNETKSYYRFEELDSYKLSTRQIEHLFN